MTFRLDTGRFPHMNYNRVIRKGRGRISRFGSPAITQRRAYSMWRVVQDVNSVREPQLALKGRARDRTREGLI